MMINQKCIFSDLFQERVTQYEGFVADHQQYNDAYNQCIEWLNSIREKLSLCADIAGDRHTIQNRLDKIQVTEVCQIKDI